MSRLIALFAVAALSFSAMFVLSCRAEVITLERVSELLPAEQRAWKEYVERSQAHAQADVAALEVEVAESGLPSALQAPDGGDFKLSHKLGDPWYAGDEAQAMADIVLSYQTPAGGWSKHSGYNEGPRKPGMQWSSQYEPGHSPHYLATFDNRSTTEQMMFLAGVWQATQREDCQAGFLKGLNYILAAQYPNGGWPQVYPLEGDYHDNITLNDDAMTHVMEVLYTVEQEAPGFEFVDETHRQLASEALAKGLHCIAEMQVEQNGTKTGWCAQHEALTLQPTGARAMEPATLSGLESARMVKFLMTISNPSPELVQTIESGLKWLQSVQVTGLTRTKLDGKTVYVSDPASTEIFWARFYDLADSKPLFPGRDGKIYDSFEEMAANNKLGYDFYSTIPKSIVTNGQKKWRKMLAKQTE